MDYPKSLPGIGLVGGKFADGDPVTGTAGSWIAAAWANAVMDELLNVITAAGLVPAEAQLDQLEQAITILARRSGVATFAEIDALTQDEGPIFCSDMAGDMYVWVSTSYFTGYRNPRSGLWYGGASDAPEAWELLANGGTWSTSNPKHARVIARYREWGRTVASGSWTKGWNHIADLGGGNWKAPDLRDVFQRMSGTDADTANARPVGEHQTDAQQNITGAVAAVARTLLSPATGALVATASSNPSTLNVGSNQNTFDISIDSSLVARTSSETRSANTAVAPVILV